MCLVAFWVAAAALARKFLMSDFIVAVAKRSWSSASLVCAFCSMFGPALIFFLWGSKGPGRCRAVGVGNMRLTDRLAAVYCQCGHAMYGAGPLLAISVEPGRLVTVTIA